MSSDPATMLALETSCSGRGLLQSQDQWMIRHQVMADTLARLILSHLPVGAENGLDVGCQAGILPDLLAARTGLRWSGIDPIVEAPRLSGGGCELRNGWAHAIPFEPASFDCVVLANVYEHLRPGHRMASLREIWRVLVPGGVLVGQLPNPYFPIDSHSRLPFMGYLPPRLRGPYWRLSPVPWTDREFYSVTVRDVRREANALGFETLHARGFNYPPAVIPRPVRWAATLLNTPPLRAIPWAWQFAFRRP